MTTQSTKQCPKCQNLEGPLCDVHVKAQHTPTPWEVKQNQNGISIEGETLSKDGKSKIREVIMSKNCAGVPELMAKAKINAAFVVRAVNGFEALEAENTRLRNCHEELLGLLKAQLTDYEMMEFYRMTPTDKLHMERIRQAIAKAEKLA